MRRKTTEHIEREVEAALTVVHRLSASTPSAGFVERVMIARRRHNRSKRSSPPRLAPGFAVAVMVLLLAANLITILLDPAEPLRNRSTLDIAGSYGIIDNDFSTLYPGDAEHER